MMLNYGKEVEKSKVFSGNVDCVIGGLGTAKYRGTGSKLKEAANKSTNQQITFPPYLRKNS